MPVGGAAWYGTLVWLLTAGAAGCCGAGTAPGLRAGARPGSEMGGMFGGKGPSVSSKSAESSALA